MKYERCETDVQLCCLLVAIRYRKKYLWKGIGVVMRMLLIFVVCGGMGCDIFDDVMEDIVAQQSQEESSVLQGEKGDLSSDKDVAEVMNDGNKNIAKEPDPKVLKSTKNIPKLSSIRQPLDIRKVPKPLILRPEHEATRVFLKQFLQSQLTNADEPWKLAHAILALGRDAVLNDGSEPIKGIFKAHAHWKKVGDVDVVYFDKFADGKSKKNPVEPHHDLLLKVITELNVIANMEVIVDGIPITLGDYYNMRLYSNYLNPKNNQSSYASTNELAWSLQGMSTWAPEKLKWIALEQYSMDMDEMTRFAAIVLQKESEEILSAMKSGASFQKNGKGIFQYTCGGSHLLQAVVHAYGMGFGDDDVKKILMVQNELLYYRFVQELKIYDQLMKQNSDYKQILLLQRLKFIGHFLESVSKMIVLADEHPRPEHLEIIKGAADQLVLTVEALRRDGLFLHIEKLRHQNHQQHLDLIGDASHALYGLELISGNRTIYMQ